MERISLGSSLRSALDSALVILRFVIPLYILADVLLYYGLLAPVSRIFSPLTGWLGLPAETALAISAGVLLNLYGAIAFAAPLGLDPAQWTILAVFLGVCHSLPVESAIMRHLGIRAVYSVSLRLGMALVTAWPLTLLPRSFYGPGKDLPPPSPVASSLADLLLHSVTDAAVLAAKVIVLIGLVILVMDRIRNLALMRTWLARFNIGFSLLVGQLLGITYGAGILIREANQGRLQQRDLLFIGTVLMICHSILEDALLFVLFGASYWLIVLPRLGAGFLAGLVILRWYDHWGMPEKRQGVRG